MWCSTAIEYSDYYLMQALMVFPFSITARVTYMSHERENLIHQEMLKADVDVVLSPFFWYHLKRDVKYTLLSLKLQGESRMLLIFFLSFNVRLVKCYLIY